jgi:hypothetical protein
MLSVSCGGHPYGICILLHAAPGQEEPPECVASADLRVGPRGLCVYVHTLGLGPGRYLDCRLYMGILLAFEAAELHSCELVHCTHPWCGAKACVN